MNHAFEEEIHYRLLSILSEAPQLGQREIAVKMGISVGKVNYCLAELAKKGLIKVKRFKSAKTKIPYTYKLTPKGIEEKGRITVRFLKRKLEEYEEIKRQIQVLTLDVEQNGLSTMARGELTQAADVLR